MAVYRETFIAYIDCDPPALLHGGFGPVLIPADAVIPAPTIALGGGELVAVPDWQVLVNGTTERIDLTLSGVSEEIARLVLEDAPSVRGAAVDVGIISFAQDWSIASISWENRFEARSLTISRPQEQNGSVSRSITLSIVHGDSARARSPNSYFTDADQRRKHPTDAIFSNVGGMMAGTSRRFGPSE